MRESVKEMTQSFDPQNGIKIIGEIYYTTPYHIHRYLPSNLNKRNH